MPAAAGMTLARSASSRTIAALLPPSSRETFLIVSAPLRMMSRPVCVEPVKVTWSTSRCVVKISATELSWVVMMLTTPAGMSVSTMACARWVALHGVSGAPLRTTVQPAASGAPSLARLSWKG